MPSLDFTLEEAPGLLRALASHDAALFDRARAACVGNVTSSEQAYRDGCRALGLKPDGSPLAAAPADLVHISRAER
jgi:hypothetical protein